MKNGNSNIKCHEKAGEIFLAIQAKSIYLISM